MNTIADKSASSESNYDCKSIRRLLDRFLDNELDSDRQAVVEEHLANCSSCMQELEKIKDIDLLGKADVFPDPGETFWKNQRKTIRAEIEKSETPVLSHGSFNLYWTKKIVHSYGLRTAIGLSAAAVLILFAAKDLDLINAPQNLLTPVQSEVPNLKDSFGSDTIEKNTSNRESSGARQANPISEPDRKSERAVQIKPSQIKESSDSRQSEIADAGAAGSIPAQPKPAQSNIQTGDSKTGNSTIRSDVPVESSVPKNRLLDAAAKTDLTRRANPSSSDIRERMTVSQQISTPNPEREQVRVSEDEFNSYLDMQAEINAIENPLERKDEWTEFLEKVSDDVVRDLVISDLFEIYNTQVHQDSPDGLKNEVVDFLTKYKESIIAIIGEKLYSERLEYFKNMMPR